MAGANKPHAPGKSNGHDQSPPEPTTGTAIEVHKVWVTRFPDKFAASLKHGYVTLPQIASSVAVATAATKEQLPLLKLQRYGGVFSANNCLRYDNNVKEISGLEGEHDKGTLSFVDAVAALRKAGIRSIVYTSPSYVPGTKERWRVLVVLSQFHAPSFRGGGLMARLNGILGGALAGESFTLSQPFYYGSVDNNPNHQVRLLDGDFIDQRPDLDAVAIFKDGGAAKSQTTPPGEWAPSESWEDLVVRILAGEPLHPSILVLAAKLVAAGTDPAAVENILRGLMDKSAAPHDKRWQERYDDIPRLVSSAEAKYAPGAAEDFSALFEQLKARANGPTPGPTPDPSEPPPPSHEDDNKTFLDNVNERLSDFDTWVPRLFPAAVIEEGETAIDIAKAHGNLPDAMAAARFLCRKNNINPVSLGYIAPRSTGDDNKAFFDKVNEMYADLGKWVPQIFPGVEWTAGDTAIDIMVANNGAPDARAAAFRLCKSASVDPETLGYVATDDNKAFLDKVNETFSDFHAWKSKVFSYDDTTYWVNSGNLTAIDFLVANDYAPDELSAALTLCRGCGVDPKALGYAGATSTRSSTGLPPLKWLDMSSWDTDPIPERQWAISNLVPLNQVGLFSQGGTGKSIIEIMKNVAHVAGKEWFSHQPTQGGAFYLGAEDEADELHIRLAVIARHYGTTFKELIAGGLKVLPLLGEDAVLCAANPKSGKVEPTKLYLRVLEQAGDLKPKNISVDTLSRAFAGNEIDRSQVYGFAMYMQALAKVASGSVTVLSHNSLAGMASGSGLSGSTAWHGAFRFRQYLKGVKAPGAEEISPERPSPITACACSNSRRTSTARSGPASRSGTKTACSCRNWGPPTPKNWPARTRCSRSSCSCWSGSTDRGGMSVTRAPPTITRL